MILFGRQRSRWWLLAIPVLLLCSPVLLMGFFAVNNLAGAIIGPPAIWQRTRHAPLPADLVGRYMETERHWGGSSNDAPKASIDLGESSIAIRSLPTDTGFKTCTLSGIGGWSGPDDDERLSPNIVSDGSAGSCASGSYPYLQLVNQSRPYGFYWTLGDPDSGEGIWFEKQP